MVVTLEVSHIEHVMLCSLRRFMANNRPGHQDRIHFTAHLHDGGRKLVKVDTTLEQPAPEGEADVG